MTLAIRKPWKIIVGLAMLGFAVTAFFYLIGTYHDYMKPFTRLDAVLGLANLVLCPPALLFAWCIDCEYGIPAGLVTNLMIVGLLNAWLYATIGFFIACRGSKKSSTTSNVDG